MPLPLARGSRVWTRRFQGGQEEVQVMARAGSGLFASERRIALEEERKREIEENEAYLLDDDDEEDEDDGDDVGS